MSEQSEGSPILDTTQEEEEEEEEEEDEDEHDQEVPNLSEEEVDTATSLNATHANRELEQRHELEVLIFQELPQRPQREDDHQHTPASPNASHAITEQPREHIKKTRKYFKLFYNLKNKLNLYPNLVKLLN